MLNDLAVLKSKIRTTGKDLDLEDNSESGNSAYDEFLYDCAENAITIIRSWNYPIPNLGEGKEYPKPLLKAELFLIQAEIVEEHGLNDAIDPEEIKVGGSEGTQVKKTRMSSISRGEVASYIRNKAYFTLFGKYPNESVGVA